MASRNNLGEAEVSFGCLKYEWKVTDFFSSERMNENWRSREFEFMGTKWQLVLRNSPPLELCIFITGYGSSNLRVEYIIGIKSFDGSIYKAAFGVKDVQQPDLPAAIGVCLSDLLIDKAKIAPQDVLTIFCNLRFKREHCKGTDLYSDTQSESSDEDHELRKNMKDLLLSGECSDVLFNVGDCEFRAHRAMLIVQSPVFARMFTHDMKEQDCEKLNITDCDPEAFEQFLLYIYTGKVDCLSPMNVYHLYQVADKYEVQGLKDDCAEYMEECLCTDTFCHFISFAFRHSEQELLEIAARFLMKNSLEILKTDKWLLYLKKNPVEAKELVKKTIHYQEQENLNFVSPLNIYSLLGKQYTQSRIY